MHPHLEDELLELLLMGDESTELLLDMLAFEAPAGPPSRKRVEQVLATSRSEAGSTVPGSTSTAWRTSPTPRGVAPFPHLVVPTHACRSSRGPTAEPRALSGGGGSSSRAVITWSPSAMPMQEGWGHSLALDARARRAPRGCQARGAGRRSRLRSTPPPQSAPRGGAGCWGASGAPPSAPGPRPPPRPRPRARRARLPGEHGNEGRGPLPSRQVDLQTPAIP